MEKTFFHVAGFSFMGLALLFLFSCASPEVAEVKTLGPPTTIGLFPITYEKNYPPPKASDTEGMDLSTIITRHVEKVLTKKGYMVKKVNFPPELVKDAPFISSEVDPSVLAENYPPDLDGLLQIHVTFFTGIAADERFSFIGSAYGRISLDATARLIDENGPKETWRKQGRAEILESANFSTRLNFAAYSLANSMFETFPSKQEWPTQ